MALALRGRRSLHLAIATVALIAAGGSALLFSRPAASRDAPVALEIRALAVASGVPAATAVPAASVVVEIDPIETGSLAPVVPTEEPTASAGFRKAMAGLAADRHAEAYELAKSLPDPAERRTIQWAAIYFGGGAIDHESVLRFSQDASEFADSPVFRTRIEQALTRADADSDEIIRILGGAMPRTLGTQIALARAYIQDGQVERGARIARAIWTENFLDRKTEQRIRKSFGELLTRDDHWARAVHLMMHDRAAGVERLLPELSEAQKSLAIARIAVSRNTKKAKALLDAVDPAYRSHPVFLFSRAQRARQFKLWDDAVSWLNKAKGEVPDAAEWWYERRTLTRQLLALGKHRLAYEAAAGYDFGPDGRRVEASFHAGWIALSFLDDAAAARQHFETMQEFATLPDTVSQANYWLGRTKLQLGDKLGANEAFATAARHRTVYYGLLARSELGLRGAHLKDLPQWQDSQAAFEARDVVRAVRLLAASGEHAMAVPLLRALGNSLEDGGELLLTARLAQSLGSHHLAISIAETADRKGFPLDLFSFPKDGLPTVKLASVDIAAVYAVTRQESRFQVDAVSSAGARGLMQLMPATAKETAAKVGLDYSKSRLTSDPAYNALLGSTYLAAQLDRYDGSLVLAAAAYNAGAGNANKWIKAFGDPRHKDIDPVVWVEMIPFEETRKYVQRVLGNYLVYRARLGDEAMTLGEALRRIPT